MYVWGVPAGDYWAEPASSVWSVGHVDSAHLITGPCVCIVKLDNGPAAAARQQEM